MKKILKISFVVLLAAGILALAVYIYGQYRNRPVQGITVHIFRDNPKKGFLNRHELLKTINKDSVLTKSLVKEVDLKKTAALLNKNPWIEKSDIFFNIEGQLIVNLKERKPIVRVFNKKGTSFYLDKIGFLFPVSSSYAPHTLIANGYIPNMPVSGNVNDSTLKKSVLHDIFQLAQLIQNDEFLTSAISQLYVNSKKQTDLIPEIGGQIIRFGSIADAKTKLENLKAFYKKAYIKYGGDRYSAINLQYINQIVCTKKQRYGK